MTHEASWPSAEFWPRPSHSDRSDRDCLFIRKVGRGRVVARREQPGQLLKHVVGFDEGVKVAGLTNSRATPPRLLPRLQRRLAQ